MTQKELNVILEKHEKWLTGKEGGEQANLEGADLKRLDFSKYELREIILKNADLYLANFNGVIMTDADLSGADCTGVDFSVTAIRGTNFEGATMDNVGIGLWDGGSGFQTDLKFVYQVLAVLCTLNVEGEGKDEFEKIKSMMLPYAVQSHIAEEVYLIEEND